MEFLDYIGPSNIAYTIALVKNSRHIWDQEMTKSEEPPDENDNDDDKTTKKEKKLRPLFTGGKGEKRTLGKSLWNKVGMKFFRTAENN